MKRTILLAIVPVLALAFAAAWFARRVRRSDPGATAGTVMQTAAVFGLELADELALGHGGVGTSATSSEGAFDQGGSTRVGATQLPGEATSEAMDPAAQPGVPPETNDDYDGEDAVIAESFPASDPPASW
jgi:hypothetical protein